MNTPLNLARQPFRNERLPTLLLGAAAFVLGAATLRQAVVDWQLLPGHARDVEGEVQSLEAQAASLRAQSSSLHEPVASRDALAECSAVKAHVDRRAFSWTG